jgi:APA family basic amino acid/polyamine antiporter
MTGSTDAAVNEKIDDQRERTSLVRALGPVDATMIVIGSMIGSGIFIVSAESSRLSGAPGWLLLAWALAGLLTITGVLCCSELATMMPRAGGVYVFLREAFGSPIGFLYGWTIVPRDPNGDDRSGSDCVREVPRRFCYSRFTR